MYNVGLTIRSFNFDGKAMKNLKSHCSVVYINDTKKRLSEEEMCEALQNIHGVIAGTERFSKKILYSAKQLKVISRVGVGVDNIDLKVANDMGIKVCNTPESPSLAVAEHTLALILAVLKRIPEYNLRMRNRNYDTLEGHLLSDKTVGIVGLGRIGRKVASIIGSFGCNVIGYDPYLSEKENLPCKIVSTLDGLLNQAEILTIHASPLETGKPLIDYKGLSKCPSGCIVINTSRGSLLDESALYAHLKSGHVAGAGLDVFEKEPYCGPLLEFSQVVITPHVSSNTVESRQTMEIEAVNNLINRLEEA